MNVVVDTAVDNDQIGTRIHIVGSAAEAEVVARLLTWLLLMGNSCSADAIIVVGLQAICFFQTVVIAVFGNVGNSRTFGDTVTEEIDG